jgi:hypothetical protein
VGPSRTRPPPQAGAGPARNAASDKTSTTAETPAPANLKDRGLIMLISYAVLPPRESLWAGGIFEPFARQTRKNLPEWDIKAEEWPTGRTD